jgi:hypothetical protein
MGGIIDPSAGDGKGTHTALPVVIPDSNQGNEQRLREALTKIWKWSNLQIMKDQLTLYGAVMGDVFIEVISTEDRVYLDAVHPGKFPEVEFDDRGNIKGYIRFEDRFHPENENQKVTYTEKCTNDNGVIVYETRLNGEPYAWDDELGATWTVDWGFVPLVMVKHNDVGKSFGWSEFHPGRIKFMEADDLASKTHDHIRKNVDPAWFMSGVTKSSVSADLRKASQEPDQDDVAPDRESLPIIYASNPQARAMAMVANLDLEAALKAISELLDELERDYPELRMDEQIAVQSNSSRAIRVARQRSEAKVVQRRPNYDNALVRAQQMAITIGGMNGFFSGFGIDSFSSGQLEHYIGNRPVYGTDPLDELEIEEKFWTVAALAAPLVGLEFFLNQHDWDKKDVVEAVAAYERLKQENRDAMQSNRPDQDLTRRPEFTNNDR